MDRLSNPWIWLKRFRHRRGYGVHSPFAFAFLTDVVYERNAYYAYHELDASLAWWQRLRMDAGNIALALLVFAVTRKIYTRIRP